MLNKKKNRRVTPSPEFVAEQLLTNLKINDREDLLFLEEIASRRNALVVYENLKGSEARLAAYDARAIITISDQIIDPHRKRFSIAHELGHWEMHRYESALSICQQQDLDNWRIHKSDRNLEAEANMFAAAFLLPKRFFQPVCLDLPPSLDAISELARSFRVSLTATTLRYIHFTPEPCAIIYSTNGKVDWVIQNQNFQELQVFIEAKVRLDASTLAHKAYTGASHYRTGRVKLDAWAAPGRYLADASIREESWHFSNYDSVLTLLWADDDIYDDEGLFWEL